MTTANLWKDWLEDYPSALYGAMIPSNISPSFADYWQRQSSKVSGEYMGALGQQALGGQPPSLSYGDFLQSYPWTKYFNQLSPGQRGLNLNLSPSVQWRV